MSASISVSTRIWRRLFIFLETVLVAGAFLSTVFAGKLHGAPWGPWSQLIAALLGGSLMLAWLFLLIVSPFFLRSLRGVALAGWVIAFGILLIGVLCPAV